MASTEQRERLKEYLLAQQERRAKMESPEYREMEDRRAMRAADSTSRNALAASLMKSAAQVGSIGGKVADASPVEDYARGAEKANANYRGMMADADENREKRYGLDARTLQYLADKEEERARGAADSAYRTTSLEQQRQIAAAKAAQDAEEARYRRGVDSQKLEFDRKKLALDTELEREKMAAAASKVDTKPTTEGERVAAGFTERAAAADAQLESILGGGYDPTTTKAAIRNVAKNIPIFGSKVKVPGDSAYQQVKDDFITAVLRKESGAAIGDEEYAREERKYFPATGDDEQTLAQKKASRQRAIANLRAIAGRADGTVQQVANPALKQTPSPGTAIAAPAAAPPPGTVRMTNDQGEEFDVLASDVADAKADGFREVK